MGDHRTEERPVVEPLRTSATGRAFVEARRRRCGSVVRHGGVCVLYGRVWSAGDRVHTRPVVGNGRAGIRRVDRQRGGRKNGKDQSTHLMSPLTVWGAAVAGWLLSLSSVTGRSALHHMP